MKRKPCILILKDGAPSYEKWYYCGLFPGGYSSLFLVQNGTLAQAISFYFRALRGEFA
jgi:hypothetical protein